MWVADFGCNTGEFSRLAMTHAAHVVAVDSDHDSVERMFRSGPASTQLVPVVAPLDDLSGGRGWAGVEHSGLAQRFERRFDVVMMLALVHHLAVGASVPLSAVAAFAARCTRQWLIVELIGDADPQLQLLCAQRRRTVAEFSAERQRAAFLSAGFVIDAECSLAPAARSLLLLRLVV
jgi:SAM-dependent methyltransferase